MTLFTCDRKDLCLVWNGKWKFFLQLSWDGTLLSTGMLKGVPSGKFDWRSFFFFEISQCCFPLHCKIDCNTHSQVGAINISRVDLDIIHNRRVPNKANWYSTISDMNSPRPSLVLWKHMVSTRTNTVFQIQTTKSALMRNGVLAKSTSRICYL
jgi:hypothetical protein